MKLQICKNLLEVLPSFSVSAYTFSLLENNDENNLSEDISVYFENIAKKYQNKFKMER